MIGLIPSKGKLKFFILVLILNFGNYLANLFIFSCTEETQGPTQSLQQNPGAESDLNSSNSHTAMTGGPVLANDC